MYNQADIAVRAMMDGGLYEVEEQAKKEGHLIHGAYHQHNVLIGQGQTAAVNFSFYDADRHAHGEAHDCAFHIDRPDSAFLYVYL